MPFRVMFVNQGTGETDVYLRRMLSSIDMDSITKDFLVCVEILSNIYGFVSLHTNIKLPCF